MTDYEKGTDPRDDWRAPPTRDSRKPDEEFLTDVSKWLSRSKKRGNKNMVLSVASVERLLALSSEYLDILARGG